MLRPRRSRAWVEGSREDARGPTGTWSRASAAAAAAAVCAMRVGGHAIVVRIDSSQIECDKHGVGLAGIRLTSRTVQAHEGGRGGGGIWLGRAAREEPRPAQDAARDGRGGHGCVELSSDLSRVSANAVLDARV